MGGIAGHMSHPFEVLSPRGVVVFFEDLFKGEIDCTEKVDGVNLFVGLNDNLQLCYARNKSDIPQTDINKLFPINHPAHNCFTAGFAAIKQAFENMTAIDYLKYDLITFDGPITKPTRWINLEIIYGQVPNIIQYSDTDNYIIFHNFTRPPEEGYEPFTQSESRDKLQAIAKKTREGVKVTTPTVIYEGFPEVGVKKVIKDVETSWVFKEPIVISGKEIKRTLSKVLFDWKQCDHLAADGEESLKQLTKSLGSIALTNIESRLFSGVRMGDADHPMIEGLVCSYKNYMIKVTGDFMSVNQDLWAIVNRNGDESLKAKVDKFHEYLLNGIMQVPKIKSISKISWEKANGDPIEFLKLKGAKKFYKEKREWVEDKFTEELSVKDIRMELTAVYSEVVKLFYVIPQDTIKTADVERTFNIAAWKLDELDKRLDNRINISRKDLLKEYANVFFNLE